MKTQKSDPGIALALWLLGFILLVISCFVALIMRSEESYVAGAAILIALSLVMMGLGTAIRLLASIDWHLAHAAAEREETAERLQTGGLRKSE